MISDIYNRVRDLTMVSPAGIDFTVNAVRQVIEEKVPGVLVECGCWKGGASLAMLLSQEPDHEKKVHLFDSFRGLPAAETRDGLAALRWQKSTDHNCRADVDLVHAELCALGYIPEEHFVIHEGWFSDTLPRFSGEPISVLRLDCDWHASVKICLEWLLPAVSPGGVVIIDDYYAWDGCARAIHEYLARTSLPYRIKTVGQSECAYFEVPF